MTQTGTVVVKLFKAEPGVSLQLTPESTWNGFTYLRPVDYDDLIAAYQLNPYHQRALQVKALAAVGLGYDLVNDAGEPQPDLKPAWEDQWQNHFRPQILSLALDLETFGNTYLEVAPAYDGSLACYWVPTYTMWVTKTGFQQQILQQRMDWPAYDGSERGIHALKLYNPNASYYGLPEWSSAMNSILLDAYSTTWNKNFFANNCMPSWAITVDGQLDDIAEGAIKDFFQSNYKGVENAHRVLLLAGSNTKITFERLQTDLRDMSFDRMKQTCRDEVVTAHGVPPRLLGIVTAGQLGGGNEMQGQLKFFVEGLIAGRQALISEYLQPLLPDGISIRFHQMDITDVEADAAWYGAMVNAGVLEPNEVRADLNRPPIEGLNEAALARMLGN